MRSFKTEIKPSKAARTYIKDACDIRRFVWNWAVNNFHKEEANDEELSSAYKLQKKLNNRTC